MINNEIIGEKKISKQVLEQISQYNPDLKEGLSSEEVSKRNISFGTNELIKKKKKS